MACVWISGGIPKGVGSALYRLSPGQLYNIFAQRSLPYSLSWHVRRVNTLPIYIKFAVLKRFALLVVGGGEEASSLSSGPAD